jgi:hypothetical protein
MTDPTRDGWGACPRGAFGRLTATLAARHARHVWFTWLAVAGGAVLTAAVGWQTAVAIDDWRSGQYDTPAHHCQPVTPATTPCPTGDCSTKPVP